MAPFAFHAGGISRCDFILKGLYIPAYKYAYARTRGDPDPKFGRENENGIFGISSRGGSEKSSFAVYLMGGKWIIFNAPKIFGAFGARVHDD